MEDGVRRDAMLLRRVTTPASEGFEYDCIRTVGGGSYTGSVDGATLAASGDWLHDLTTQTEAAFSAEYLAARLCKTKRVEFLVVHLDQTLHDELSKDRTPLVRVHICSDAERSQFLVPELLHFRRALTA